MIGIKKILLFGLLLFFSINAFAAASITQVKIPSTVPLNTDLTIYGKYTDTGSDTNVLCSFFLFDTADQNQAIVRLSDEYVFSDGSFYSSHKITEPSFRRGFDYNAVVICGLTGTSQIFKIEQKEELVAGITPQAMLMEVRWWVEPQNTMTVVFIGFAILLIAALMYGLTKDIFNL